jgi:hypothetical protein
MKVNFLNYMFEQNKLIFVHSCQVDNIQNDLNIQVYVI